MYVYVPDMFMYVYIYVVMFMYMLMYSMYVFLFMFIFMVKLMLEFILYPSGLDSGRWYSQNGATMLTVQRYWMKVLQNS
jgi:hypothetical protein